MMDMSSTAARHHANIAAKANRAIALIEEWAANLDGDRAANLTAIRDALTGAKGRDNAEMFWTKLSELHGERYPTAPAEPFDASRAVALAKLDARIWTAGRPAPADPFAGLAA